MKNLIITAVFLAVLIFLEVYRELHCFKVTHYHIDSPHFPGSGREMRIVYLSDLHNHEYGKGNRKLLKAVADVHPDLILAGGDMLVGKPGHDYEKALRFVKQLVSFCPVFYANGNHEQRMKEYPGRYRHSYESYRKELQEAGVIFLENESMDFSVYGVGEKETVRITGLEIPLSCYKHFCKGVLDPDKIRQKIGESDGQGYQILMAHNPSYVKEYKDWGADLILCGHLHGGIVRIPGLTGMISPASEWFPQYSGDLYREGDTAIVVSKGLGTHTVNIRFLNPAEVIVLHMNGTMHQPRPRSEC